MSEHAVIVNFTYGTRSLDALFEVEDRLIAAIEKAGVGELDGHEIAADSSNGTYYMYGPDADKLFEAARPVLEAAPFTKTAEVELRYGPPEEGVRVREVKLGT